MPRPRNGRRRNYLSANNYRAAVANLWLGIARNLLRVAASPPKKTGQKIHADTQSRGRFYLRLKKALLRRQTESREAVLEGD